MTKTEDGIHWLVGIGFGLYFLLIFQPSVSDFIENLPWMFKFIVFALGIPIAFAGSIIFPLFLYETLRKIGFSEGIAWAVLGLGFLVFYATVMDF